MFLNFSFVIDQFGSFYMFLFFKSELFLLFFLFFKIFENQILKDKNFEKSQKFEEQYFFNEYFQYFDFNFLKT